MKTNDQKSKAELRDEYRLKDLEIKGLGEGWKEQAENTWAVFINSESNDFVPLKLYKIEKYKSLSKAKTINEKGQKVFCPLEWFLEINLEKNTTNIFEKVSV